MFPSSKWQPPLLCNQVALPMVSNRDPFPFIRNPMLYSRSPAERPALANRSIAPTITGRFGMSKPPNSLVLRILGDLLALSTASMTRPYNPPGKPETPDLPPIKTFSAVTLETPW